MGLVTERALTARGFFCRTRFKRGDWKTTPVTRTRVSLVEFHRRACVRAALGVPLANRSVGFTNWREHPHDRRRLEELTPVYLHSYIPPGIGYSRPM